MGFPAPSPSRDGPATLGPGVPEPGGKGSMEEYEAASKLSQVHGSNAFYQDVDVAEGNVSQYSVEPDGCTTAGYLSYDRTDLGKISTINRIQKFKKKKKKKKNSKKKKIEFNSMDSNCILWTQAAIHLRRRQTP